MFVSVLKDLIYNWKERPDSHHLYFCCWILFTLIFFSASKSKLPGYVLPAVPPLAVLLSQSISLRIQKIVPGDRWIGIASGIAILGITMAIDKLPFAIDYFPPGPLFWVVPVDFLAAITAVILGARRRATWALVLSTTILMFTLTLGPTGDAKWALDLGTSARWATRIPDGVSRDYWSNHTATYKLPRAYDYSVNFYMHRELSGWSGSTAERNWVFTTPKEMSELRGLKCPHFMAFSPVIVCEAAGLPPTPPRREQPH